MSKKKKKGKKTSSTSSKRFQFSLTKQQKILLGSFLIFLGVALLLSFTSYLFSWHTDQSTYGSLSRELETKNWLSKFGAHAGNFFIYQGFGVASFIPAFLLTLSGVHYFMNFNRNSLYKNWMWGLLITLWLSVTLGFFDIPNLSGIVGFEMNDLLQDYIGTIGTALLLAFVLIIYLVVRLRMNPEGLKELVKSSKEEFTSEIKTSEANDSQQPITKPVKRKPSIQKLESPILPEEPQKESKKEVIEEEKTLVTTPTNTIIEPKNEGDVAMEIEQVEEEEEVDEIDELSDSLVKKYGKFDPRLELSTYRFPSIELLRDHTLGGGITINQEELEENKDRIVDTLNNYKIGIANIKATVGPTVTLYEIVPEAGIRISKIKNLEDDIALSLSALGIRIIAPIPGRGTIGIEVPNKNPKIVSMRSVIASKKFQNAEMELPIAFGKTISNETFVVDLAKMPHLLMAGATGQGKSVGLNAILTSLLYKKHPAEVKFVLVDPKKVELTLFNKIERHYLAKLPDTDEAIITDTTKVINTLNSLCIEMDDRYDLLKDAMVRNIKEYNRKFKNRKLNPNEGHKFLPYIVLVIDEFADLIMTAGKEVETPIARLAQLARAVGIHLIVATQRPSVNVITGIIKANFPARVAFRVTSKIDSRTILDNSGADQLIGRGDMLYTQGNELTRIQCAFVDTPEIDDITDFIGSQKAYPQAHLLPEYDSGEGGTNIDIAIDERDSKFREAAELIVQSQQGSTSMLQRKLKLGYNRAGRIIDQLEAAGIVGPFEGSKAREVLVPTLDALNQLLDNEIE